MVSNMGCCLFILILHMIPNKYEIVLIEFEVNLVLISFIAILMVDHCTKHPKNAFSLILTVLTIKLKSTKKYQSEVC